MEVFSMTADKNNGSPLLELPAELRNIIWQQLVANDPSCEIEIRPNPDNLSCANWSPPEITRVCRQIRSETIPMFLGQNTFLFAVHSFEPFFPILRRALTYLKITNPGRRLDGFRLEIKEHFPLQMMDLVEYARIFGFFAAQLPVGPVPFQGMYQANYERVLGGAPDHFKTIAGREEFGIFLQDLASLGRELQASSLPFHQVRYEKAVQDMIFEEGVGPEHFRRLVIWDGMEHLRRVRKDVKVPDWIQKARNKGTLRDVAAKAELEC